MKQRTHPSARLLCSLIATTAVLMYGGRAAATDLNVCVDKTSPTAAVDTQLAQAVAAQEGATLHVHPFDGSGGDDGFDLKEFATLTKDSCSLVIGFPIDADAHAVPAGMQATEPYGHTGFVLVTGRNSNATTLDQLPKNTDVAVTYQTTPNLYFVDHPTLQADVHLSDKEALKALESHSAQAAMLWQPTVVRYLADHHEATRFRYHALNERHAQFNLVALYGSDSDAAAKFEKAIAAMSTSGALAKLLQPYAEVGAAPSSDRPQTALLRRSSNSGRADRTCGGKAAPGASAALPALYTSTQADSGKAKFQDNCSMCHGPQLEGRAGPALKGPNFASAKAKFHVGDVFTIVSQNMPATQPGSLAHDDYVEIMAFLLQQNGYPAGSTALTFDSALHSKVKLLYHGD